MSSARGGIRQHLFPFFVHWIFDSLQRNKRQYFFRGKKIEKNEDGLKNSCSLVLWRDKFLDVLSFCLFFQIVRIQFDRSSVFYFHDLRSRSRSCSPKNLCLSFFSSCSPFCLASLVQTRLKMLKPNWLAIKPGYRLRGPFPQPPQLKVGGWKLV